MLSWLGGPSVYCVHRDRPDLASQCSDFWGRDVFESLRLNGRVRGLPMRVCAGLCADRGEYACVGILYIGSQ